MLEAMRKVRSDPHALVRVLLAADNLLNATRLISEEFSVSTQQAAMILDQQFKQLVQPASTT